MDAMNGSRRKGTWWRGIPRAGFALVAGIAIATGLYNGLKIQPYRIETDNVARPIRLALITDLHSCRYGKKQRTLIDAITSQQPDAILLGGDICDDSIADTNTEYLLQGIASRYPCYYVTGNHEYWNGKLAAHLALMASYDVTVLAGTYVTLSVHGQDIVLCGVSDPEESLFLDEKSQADYVPFVEQLAFVAKARNTGLYTVLLSHRPEYFTLYVNRGFDLALCGHAHGGQWRIPGIVNGLYAPNQGIFPRYAGGCYRRDGTTMIVSRGLARESTRIIPRLYNRPELVIVDICPASAEKKQ